MTSTPSIVTKAEQLRLQIDKFHSFHWKNHVRNRRSASALVVLGLSLGASTTAAGFLGKPTAAGCLGLVTTLFIGLHDAFNFSEKSDFFNDVHAAAKILRDKLKYRVESAEEFNLVFDEFQALRQRAARDVPKGKGISMAKRSGEAANE